MSLKPFEALTQALEAPSGVRIEFNSKISAVNFRARCYRIRTSYGEGLQSLGSEEINAFNALELEIKSEDNNYYLDITKRQTTDAGILEVKEI